MRHLNPERVVDRIFARHAAVDEEGLGDRFPDQNDLLAVVRFVRRSRRLIGKTLHDDLHDATLLLRYVMGLCEDETVALIDRGRSQADPKDRWTWASIATAHGMRGPGSAEELHVRLTAARNDPEGRRDSSAVRDERRHLRAYLHAARECRTELLVVVTDVLAHRKDVLTNEVIEEHLDDLALLMDPRETPWPHTDDQIMALATHLRMLVAKVLAEHEATGLDPVRTPPAYEALKGAEALGLRVMGLKAEVEKRLHRRTVGAQRQART